MSNENGTIISISESYEIREAPELAKITVVVSFEGEDKTAAHQKCVSVSNDLKADIEQLVDEKNGPVTKYSTDQIRASSRRPHNKDGKVLPLRYTSSITHTVTFDDFEKLSEWIPGIVEIEGTSFGYIYWDLKKENREKKIVDSRHAAVQKAIKKADSYADALGLKVKQTLEIADSGMLSSSSNAGGDGFGARSRSLGIGSNEDTFELNPEPVVFNVRVEGRFLAS